jgi:hypothetical protein
MQWACAVSSSVACPTLQYFPILSHINGTAFWKKVIEHKICVLVFPAVFVWNIPHSKQKKLKDLHGQNANVSYFHEFTFHAGIKFFYILTIQSRRS